MKKITVAILFGGCSSEYEVSLKSATAVLENLDLEKYDVLLLGITKEGQWLQYGGSTDRIKNDTWHQSKECVPAFLSPCRQVQGVVALHNGVMMTTRVDVVFPVLHGKNGEDGTVQGLLALAGIPFVGCHSLSSAICMDKDIAHILAASSGVKTPRSVTVFKNTDPDNVIAAVESLGFPLYVKPAKSGSSLGITKAHNTADLVKGIENAFYHDNKVVIEENIEGFEVGCAVLGNGDVIVGEVDEIELSHGFFNYNEKYSLETSRIHVPARIEKEMAEKIKETAIRLYQVLDCRGFARVDMFVTPTNEIVFNEVNTIPGFTTKSRYPSMLRAAGISYKELLDTLIFLAMEAD
ncbi:D-alanine--D-serine ligase VanG [Brevibacillus ruminantium]|uniref:D-alanine--D-alanine ligase n=1 Tax=Brevibacillus ruminantium TaxID=2950604 RepID=A0ABY4WL38_9BACL|nr:D-alanine--D-serine ligase VanG [Brevibacillus ruminantium]USG67866.1 D-alanine--D-serine ligase VanG [Brevibacillus ruminantium]